MSNARYVFCESGGEKKVATSTTAKQIFVVFLTNISW